MVRVKCPRLSHAGRFYCLKDDGKPYKHCQPLCKLRLKVMSTHGS